MWNGSDGLFSDGWRDPGDDCARDSYYIQIVLTLAMGVSLFVGGIWSLAHPETMGMSGEYSAVGAKIVAFLMAFSGAVLAPWCAVFLFKESRRWDLRHLTAEKFVAGGFVIGFALMLIGGYMLEGGSRGVKSSNVLAPIDAALICLGLGIADLVVFLIIGLIIAFFPAMRPKRKLQGVTVERRFAVDDKLNEIEDHPCPWEDGMQAFISLRMQDGRKRTLTPTRTAYEIGTPGKRGTAIVKGRMLERFQTR